MADNLLRKVGKSIYDMALKPRGDIGMKDENNPGTAEYNARLNDFEKGIMVLDEWAEGDTVYSEVYNRISKNRDYYMGESSQQWNSAIASEGDMKLIFNVGATIVDLFTYILANNPPYIQFLPDDTNEVSLVKADFTEELTKKWLADAKFPKRFRDGVKTHFMLGFSWLFLVWNPANKDGGEKGTLEISLLNGFSTRVKFADNDYEKVESFITEKRLSKLQIQKLYNFDALPDQEDTYIPKSIQSIDDGKTTVFTRYDDDSVTTVINGRAVNERKTDYGFVTLVPVNNIFVPNDALGHGESERWQSTAQELNALLTMASEIARDLAYPPILEYNNALGGRKIPKWRGQKIPVRRSDKGEAVEYLRNLAQIQPLLKQAELLLELLHFISLMPKAAAGVFDSSVTSGFQAKLAMQPATLTTENRKVDWSYALREVVKMGLRIMVKENPEVFKVKLPSKETYEMKDLYRQQVEVIWPDNLPIDISREVQNLVLGINNNLTSVHQAIDRYNILVGLGSPTDTEEFLKQEAKDEDLNPERVAKVAKARQMMEQLGGVVNQAQAKLGEMGQQLPPASSPPAPLNPTNLNRAAVSPFPEEQRVTSQIQSQNPESIALESTGGILPNRGAV